MTTTVTEATKAIIDQQTYDALSSSAGIIAILAFLLLLALKECARAFGGPMSGARMRTLDIAILPLGAAFAVIITTRFMDLL